MVMLCWLLQSKVCASLETRNKFLEDNSLSPCTSGVHFNLGTPCVASTCALPTVPLSFVIKTFTNCCVNAELRSTNNLLVLAVSSSFRWIYSFIVHHIYFCQSLYHPCFESWLIYRCITPGTEYGQNITLSWTC